MTKIDLNASQLNFKAITNAAITIYGHDSLPYIYFEKRDTIRHLLLLQNDWGYVSERNILEINKDSILKGKGYPLKDLGALLKKHYENNGKYINFPNSSETASVIIQLDTNATSNDLINTIIYLTNEFDQLNKKHGYTLKLRVGLSYHASVMPPKTFFNQEK